MKLWILRLNSIEHGYDCSLGFVVGAEDELSARQIASTGHGDETKYAWTNPERSTCEELVPVEGIIMCDFNAG